MRLLRLLLAPLAAALVWGQTLATCTVTTTPQTIRANGVRELVSSVALVCSNAATYTTGTTLPAVNITVTANAPITSRVLATDSGGSVWTEALAVRDNPAPAQQFFCASSCAGLAGTAFSANNPSVYQGRLSNPNTLVWTGIPIDAGSHRIALTNIRVDATASSGDISVSVAGSLLSISNPTVTVATPASPLTGSMQNAAKTAAGPVTVVTSTGATAVRVGTLRLTELTPRALKRRSASTLVSVDAAPVVTAGETSAEAVFLTESGFSNPAFPNLSITRGNLALAGLADSGTRVRAVFSGIPAGVTLLVAPSDDNATTSRALRLISGSASGPFATTAGSAPVALSASGGTAAAVWEVLSDDTATSDTYDLGIFATYTAAVAGQVSVAVNLEPGTVTQATFPQFTGSALASFVALNFQTTPPPSSLMTCSLSSTAVGARAGGQAELTASALLTCTGGFPVEGTFPTATFSLALSTASGPARITSRPLASSSSITWTEGLLLVDDPAPGSQYPCLAPTGLCSGFGNGSGGGTGYYGAGEGQNRNVYQGTTTGTGTALSFAGIPIDPPPAATGVAIARRYRFENIRFDTTGLAPGPVTLTLQASPAPAFFSLANTTTVVAYIQTPLPAVALDARGVNPAPAGGIDIDTTTPQSAPQRLATLRLREAFATQFKIREAPTLLIESLGAAESLGGAPPQAQPFPGANYPTETGFYNPAFPSVSGRGNLGLAGLADHGLRLFVRFSGVPAGVQVFVNSQNDETQTVARLVSTDANGNGPFLAGPSGVVPVALTNGNGLAVYEFLQTNVQDLENASFGVFLTHAANIQTTTPIRVEMAMAPFSSTAIPRFAQNLTPLNLFTFRFRNIDPEPVSLIVNPAALTFTVFEGQTSAAQALSMASSNPNIPLDVSIEGPGTFPMTISPGGGRTSLTASAQASAGTLPAGRYDGLMRINAGRAINAPVIVPVTLIVLRNFSLLSIDPEVVQAGGNGFRLTGIGRFVPAGSSLAWNGEVLNTTGAGDRLVADVPARLYAQPGRALITIRAGDGRTSNALPLEIVPRVFITRLDQERVTATRPGFNLTVIGGGYVAASQVRFGGESLGPQSGSETRLVVALTTAQLAEPRVVPVQVVNPFNIVSNVVDFIIDPVPVITSLDPPSIAPGAPVQPVRIRGRNFRSEHTVRITGAGGSTAFVSPEEILLTLAAPAATGSYGLTVVTADGVASNTATLVVQRPAVVTGPPLTAGDGGGSITIDGSGFVPGSVIEISVPGQPPVRVTPTNLTPTQITFTLPPGVINQPGPVMIQIVPPPGGGTPPPPIQIVVNPAPRIDGVTPGSLVVGVGAGSITVTGTGIPAGSQILINGQPIPTTVASGGQATGTPPPAVFSTPGPLRVQLRGPGGALSNTFTVNVVLPALPESGFDGVPGTANSRQMINGRARLASPFPVDVAVQVLLGFAPDGALPDDPLIRFANGSRTLNATIRAGADPVVPFALETGSTAGVISLTLRLTPTGGDATAGPVTRITIARRAPELTALECRRDNAARTLSIVADGISNTRETRQGNFQFQAAPGASVPTTQFTVDVATLFNAWFGSTASQALGGVFRYTQNFTIQGDPAAITGVTLSVTNAVGASNSLTTECR